jgi:hypothetical protein
VDGALYYQASNPSNYIATVSTGSGLTGSGTSGSPLLVDSAIYQQKLVSASNIKTLNGSSVLGSGDLVLSGFPVLTSGKVVKSNGITGVDSSIYDNASLVTIDGSIYAGSTLATYPLGNNSIHASGGLEVDGVIYGNGTGISSYCGIGASRSVTTIYQATTDGFVYVYVEAGAGSYADLNVNTTTPPTTRRWEQYNAGHTSAGGVSYFVKKNDYYRVVNSGATVAQYLFFPCGS